MIKKILIALLMAPLMVLAQSYPSPTFNNIAVQGSVIGSMSQPASGNFYQGQSGIVNRINDRLFVNAASLNNGTQVASQPDWLTQFQLATGRANGFIQLANFAVLNGSHPQNQEAMVVAAQSSTNTLSGSAIGAILMGINNNTSVTGSVWGAYIEAYRMAGVSGGADGLEIDTANFGGNVVLDPYQQNVAQTIGLQLASGAELSPTGQYPSQAAINIQNNHMTFDKGIVFGSNSITGATGSSGTGIAIALGYGHTLQWYGAAATPIASIVASGTTTAQGIQQLFSDNTVSFNNASGKQIFSALGVASGVNGITALGASTGNPPQLVASGTDTNISLQMTPKGTGSVVASGPLSVTGTITPSQTSGIVGTTTNNNANAGSFGEYTSNSASGVSLTTTVAANVTSISLTAGDWDVSGTVTFVPAGSTTIAQIESGTSTTSATFGGIGTFSLLTLPFTTGQNDSLIAPPQRISIASTTTVFLVASANFGVSTMTANGFIRARRVR